jgi:hypothetical protein
MRKNRSLTLRKANEARFLNPVFDLGGANTITATSAGLNIVIFRYYDVSADQIVRKLDSLKEEPAVEYGNDAEARLHIKKLMQE